MQRILLIVLTLVLGAACSKSPQADTRDERFQVETVASALSFPWSLAFLPDGGFLITEREGKLLHLSADGKRRVDISGLPKNLEAGGQGGLHDVVLAPDFAQSRMIYFSYAGVDKKGGRNTEVARAVLDLKARTLRNVEALFVATPKVSGGQHFGGRLLFAPDGKLFVTLGDRNMRDDAQNLENHLGTLVRINTDGSTPDDTPTFSKAAARAVYSYGHRNIQGIALQPGTSRIWLHEHGPRGGDELNIVKPGANYGWPTITYGREYTGFSITDKTHAEGMEQPVIHWTPSIAPSGMAFYMGNKFPEWQGNLFVGALVKTHLRRLVIEDDKVIEQEELLGDLNERIRDVRNGPDGYIYLLTDSDDGRLLRLIPRQ